MMSKDRHSSAIKSEPDKSGLEQQINQSILQNRIFNEQSIRNRNTKSLDHLKSDKLDCLSVKVSDQTDARSGVQEDARCRTETDSDLKPQSPIAHSNHLDDNYQVMYNMQTPLVQSTLDAMDIYYPTTDLLTIDYPLNIKDHSNTRHLDTANFSQSIDRQFYNAASKCNDDSVYSFHTENICNSLAGPGVNSTVCDDYVLTFLN